MRETGTQACQSGGQLFWEATQPSKQHRGQGRGCAFSVELYPGPPSARCGVHSAPAGGGSRTKTGGRADAIVGRFPAATAIAAGNYPWETGSDWIRGQRRHVQARKCAGLGVAGPCWRNSVTSASGR
jgi:hypothetical protein